MNTLRLNVINLHAPYRVWQKSGKPDHYYFVSDSGVEFKSSHFVTVCLCVGLITMSIVISISFRLQRVKWMVR